MESSVIYFLSQPLPYTNYFWGGSSTVFPPAVHDDTKWRNVRVVITLAGDKWYVCVGGGGAQCRGGGPVG